VLNRDVFLRDPTSLSIPNLGVAKIGEPRTPAEWDVLRFELESFVCEGEYARGLETVLSTFLGNVGQPSQPAAWVSGFYGSGKSHLARVLQYLWRDVEFPDGARARGIAQLPREIRNLLTELSTAGRQNGGLWAAAGTLGAGAGSVRLALLSILFAGAGLSTQYPEARLVIWLKQEGHYEAVRAAVEAQGRTLENELHNMFISPALAQSLIDVVPGIGGSTNDVHAMLRSQYRVGNDIDDTAFVRAVRDVLGLQSTAADKTPLTLLVFDELQQFIAEDPTRTMHVQDVVEACVAQFGSRLLVLGTGQAALQATPQLSKLIARFRVQVMLSDTDVEKVVRAVVLRKDPARQAELKSTLDTVSGEIDRQLRGTRIEPRASDASDLVPDYPLLPVRRRFWERVLRAIDSAGAAGQLRTQLRIVLEAAKAVALRPLGSVVPADYIYGQLEADMLQSGVLLRETAEVITDLDDGSEDGQLRSRLAALIFLIDQLPTDGPAATGIRATAESLADLATDDLLAGSGPLRQRVPSVLQGLVDDGALILVHGEYRLQTRESAEWETDYRVRLAKVRNDSARLASDRGVELRTALNATLKGVTLVQGQSKTPRKFELSFAADPPKSESGAVPIWVRDEWSVPEATVIGEAHGLGTESPVVTVFLPKYDADMLQSTLASLAAANEVVQTRVVPATPEGQQARSAMQSRVEVERAKLSGQVKAVLEHAHVYQGGGNELVEDHLATSVKVGLEAALARLFPRFGAVDHGSWGTVVTRASQGAGDALAAVGYHGDVEKYAAAQEVRTFIGAGKRGTEVRRHFMGTGYGWPQDTVDGLLLVLVRAELVSARRDGQAVASKSLTQAQIGNTEFKNQVNGPTQLQRIEIRGTITKLGLQCKAGEEAAAVPVVLDRMLQLADAAGGDPPLPERPDTTFVKQLQGLVGNEQLAGFHDQRSAIEMAFHAWSASADRARERTPRWRTAQRLALHAHSLPLADGPSAQLEAIENNRALLEDPDPLAPPMKQFSSALRSAVQAGRQQLADERDREVVDLEASADWQKLPEADQQRILDSNGLGRVPSFDLGTDAALLAVLDTTPLAELSEKIAAVPNRASQARAAAAKLLEPQAVTVTVPHATLRSEPELDAYLAQLRASILEHVGAGRPVIV
jgi:hypothetical protein